MIQSLEFQNVGPWREAKIDFAPRINLLVGDNGLGKTFVLDSANWGLSRSWHRHRPVSAAAASNGSEHERPRIEISIADGSEIRSFHSSFSFENQGWSRHENPYTPPPPLPFYSIHFGVGGEVTIWDERRNVGPSPARAGARGPRPIEFEPAELWQGKRLEDGAHLCRGMIDDFVDWQTRKAETFETFRRLLAGLSEGLDEPLIPGEPMRVSVGDVRDHPTLALPYGTVPVDLASAGMKRILSMAYAIVHAWSEHREASKFFGAPPLSRLLILLDEVESHLHPKWQRLVLPSLLRALKGPPFDLPDTSIQLLASTHSPMVAASLETIFDPAKDRVLNFELARDERDADGRPLPPTVRVESIEWTAHGDATSWLESDVFGLGEARSIEAERAIEKARASIDRADVDPDLLRSVHDELRSVLKDLDPFWPRWISYADRKGVEL